MAVTSATLRRPWLEKVGFTFEQKISVGDDQASRQRTINITSRVNGRSPDGFAGLCMIMRTELKESWKSDGAEVDRL